jgi:hypothetical protein
MPVRPHKRIAELAHQLAAFRTTSPSPDVSNFEGPVIYLIEYLVIHRSPPKSAKNLRYPPDWEISRSSLNRAYTEFVNLADSLEITSSSDFLDWIGENPLSDADQAEPIKPLGRTRSRSRSTSSSIASQEKGKAPISGSEALNTAPVPSTTPTSDVTLSSPPSTPQPNRESSSDDPLSQPPTVKKIVIDFLPKHFDKAVKRLSFGTSESIESSLVEPSSTQPSPAQPSPAQPSPAQPSPAQPLSVEPPSVEVPASFETPATTTTNQPKSEGSPDINLEFQEVTQATSATSEPDSSHPDTASESSVQEINPEEYLNRVTHRRSRLTRIRERGFNFRFGNYRTNSLTTMSGTIGAAGGSSDADRAQPTIADLFRLMRRNQEEPKRRLDQLQPIGGAWGGERVSTTV